MIVGLLGFIGSGKGTAGDILKSMGFTPISFAKGVKDITAEMFGWPRHLLEGDTQLSRDWREQPCKFWSRELGKEFTPRYALQLMGTQVGRDVFDENFWVIKLKNYIDNAPKQNYVITDVRFQNEIDFISENNGTLIEIRRGITPHWYDIAAKANRGDERAKLWMQEQSDVHESEWKWIGGNIDHVIDNDKGLEDLRKNLLKCLTVSFGPAIIDYINEGVL